MLGLHSRSPHLAKVGENASGSGWRLQQRRTRLGQTYADRGTVRFHHERRRVYQEADLILHKVCLLSLHRIRMRVEEGVFETVAIEGSTCPWSLQSMNRH